MIGKENDINESAPYTTRDPRLTCLWPTKLARAVRAAIVLAPDVAYGAGFAALPAMAQESSKVPSGVRQGAQSEQLRRFAIPPQPLASALDRFSVQTGISFAYTTSQLEGIQSQGVTGTLTFHQALAQLLIGTGVTFVFIGADTVSLKRNIAQQNDRPLQLGLITVEGNYTGNFEKDEGFKPEYQVSVTKTPLSLQETPQSISVIMRESIDARFARDQSTALELAAGTYSAGGPGPFAGRPGRFDQRFIFRGVQLTGERYVEHLPDLETALAD